MSNDDCHIPTVTIQLKEKQFPEIFDFKNKKIDLTALTDPDFEKSVLSAVKGADIAALPTALLNPYILKELGVDADSSELNRAIGSAFSRLKGNIKTAGTLGLTKTPIDPFGETSFTELITCYDEQVNALKDYVDYFIIDNIKSMTDLRAALLSCKKTNIPVTVIIAAELFESSENYSVSALGALTTAQEMGADCFGISLADGFSENEKDEAAEIINELFHYAKIPIVMDFTRNDIPYVSELSSLGIENFIFTSNQFPAFPKKTKSKMQKPPVSDDFFIFTHYGSVFFLEADTTEISEPIQCRPDMEEIICSVCETSCDILRVEINTSDDAIDFARNAHMSTLPVMFLSENVIALKMALLLYQGIALIDSSTLIPGEELDKICKKYGAVVY